MNQLTRTILFVLATAVFFSAVALRVNWDAPVVQNDAFSLLPEIPRIQEEDTVRFLFSGDDWPEAKMLLRETLSPIVEFVEPGPTELEELCFKLSPYRAAFLSKEVLSLLECEPVEQCFKEHLLRALTAEDFSGTYFTCDPLLLSTQGIRSALLSSQDERVLIGRVRDEGSVSQIEDAIRLVEKQHSGLSITWSGYIRFAHSSKERFEEEFALLGFLSMLCIVVLLRLAFGSFLPLTVALVSSLVGFLFGAGVCVLLRGSIHGITLTLGGSLLGACVDYAVHWVSERYYQKEAPQPRVWSSVSPVLRLGMYTSILAIAPFFFSSSQLLQEFFLFCLGALSGSYLVLSCIPLPKRVPDITSRFHTAGGLTARLSKVIKHPVVLSFFLVVTIYGLVSVESDDDIRLLQSPPDELIAAEEAITVGRMSNALFVVEPKNSDQQMEAVSALFAEYGIQSTSDSVQLTFPFSFPALKDQEQFLKRYLEYSSTNQGLIKRVFDDLGIEAELSLEEQRVMDRGLFQALVPEFVNEKGDILFPVSGWNGEGQVPPGVSVVHYRGEISRLFQEYREESLLLLLLGYLVVSLFLAMREKSIRGCLLLAPCLVAACMTIACLSVFGFSINFFTTVVLALVLGLSVDYAVFFAESPDTKPVSLSVLLSSSTTMLAFLPLLLSDTALIRSVGVAMFVGVLTATLTSPLMSLLRSRNTH